MAPQNDRSLPFAGQFGSGFLLLSTQASQMSPHELHPRSRSQPRWTNSLQTCSPSCLGFTVDVLKLVKVAHTHVLVRSSTEWARLCGRGCLCNWRTMAKCCTYDLGSRIYFQSQLKQALFYYSHIFAPCRTTHHGTSNNSKTLNL